jgi:hypothetical protein
MPTCGQVSLSYCTVEGLCLAVASYRSRANIMGRMGRSITVCLVVADSGRPQQLHGAVVLCYMVVLSYRFCVGRAALC